MKLITINYLKQRFPNKIRNIEASDEARFYEYLHLSMVERSAFANNWPYIIQATRGEGYIYEENNEIIYFYLREKSAKKLQLVIVNHFCHSFHLITCLSEAAKELGIYILLKNIDKANLSWWQQYGFQETSMPWSQFSLRDDNSFPESIIPVEQIINFHVKGNVNQTTMRLIKRIQKSRNINVIPYNSTHESSLKQLLHDYSFYLQAKGTESQEQVLQSHAFMFDSRIENKIVLTHIENEKIVGISYLTLVKENLFFIAMVNLNQSNLMRFLLWQAVDYVYCYIPEAKNLQWLALQGCENGGQKNWKACFYPKKIIDRTHITNQDHFINLAARDAICMNNLYQKNI